jgi:hypothetical protein
MFAWPGAAPYRRRPDAGENWMVRLKPFKPEERPATWKLVAWYSFVAVVSAGLIIGALMRGQ